ncbi:DUF6542 domain-containing protein [Mycobacterium cookii]|uniref:DUF6542 domain-containing protein n=1 Tax=Mycobacterium cookii TaxID=1775 RepID=UPI0013D0934D|nr:DUF6542 domain-containing protein [Mycobacterium cookii]MCV7331880.1 hypothetical protein [Mycobacterium cookii]
MSAEQTRSAVTADHRSIVPSVPGLPWWAAVVIAVTGAAVGFAFDAGSGKELTSVFSGLYVVGCLAAVLAVRQAGIFTAVIQPPLILFCAVPGAYFLFHGAKFTGIKDLLINCGYPLIERFPLMLFTSAAVLLIGLVRWGLDRVVHRSSSASDDAAAEDTSSTGGAFGLVARLSALFNRESDDDEAVEKPARQRTRRTHAVERSTRSASARRTGGRPEASRTRRPRPPLGEAADPARDRARRRRPTHEIDGPEPPRRGRLPRDLEQRGRPPWEVRRETQARRGRPTSRFEPREPVEPYDATPPPRRRPGPNGSSRATATHHPISRVRYRNDESQDEPTSRPPRPRKAAGENWDYDR